MIALSWSPQSLDDIESIRAYIFQDSPAYADLVVRRLVAAVERLRIFRIRQNRAGTQRPEDSGDYRAP